MSRPDFLHIDRFQGPHAFEEKPQFYNHMCHWAPWADHFCDDKDEEKATLACMLGSALIEIDRLCKYLGRTKTAHSQLLWAYVRLVETGKETTFGSPHIRHELNLIIRVLPLPDEDAAFTVWAEH